MSYSTLFLGINITQFYRKEAIVKHETRYNEITGEPYLKEFISYEYYVADYKITTELQDFGKPYNLDVLTEYYEDKIYLGITLAHNNFEDFSESIEINLDKYNKALELLKEKLTILGWQDEEIKLIMNCYNSY